MKAYTYFVPFRDVLPPDRKVHRPAEPPARHAPVVQVRVVIHGSPVYQLVPFGADFALTGPAVHTYIHEVRERMREGLSFCRRDGFGGGPRGGAAEGEGGARA